MMREINNHLNIQRTERIIEFYYVRVNSQNSQLTIMSTDQSFRIDDNIQLVHNFRCLLEEEMFGVPHSLNGESKPISESTRNKILMKLNRMRQVTRKVRAELDLTKKELMKPFIEAFDTAVKNREEMKRVQFKAGTQTQENGNKQNQRALDSNQHQPSEQLKKFVQPKFKRNADLTGSLESKASPVPHKLPIVFESNGVLPINPPTKDLRAQIYKELEQLRNLEKREKVVRNLNESRQRSVSEAKKKPQKEQKESLTKEAQSVIQDRTINKVPSNLTFETEYSQQSLVKDVETIQVNVPEVSVAPRSILTNLFCPNRHEYYSGAVVNKVPHGHGRLYNCCSRIPLAVPQSVEFYTGGFVKGKFEGYGTLTTREGVKFVGNFKEGLKHGEGSLFYKGKVELARWANDKFLSNI